MTLFLISRLLFFDYFAIFAASGVFIVLSNVVSRVDTSFNAGVVLVAG